MRALFRQFSFPGGIPSHVAPETPGSIHEGGELGYALVHAFGAAYDNPDLVVLAVVGDGEAETGPLAASWHSNKFLNPVTDGAVLPVLHLNGYKIANPTLLARIPEHELAELMRGYGYDPHFVGGVDERGDDTCTEGTQVYMVAYGGNPGMTGVVNNTAIVQMAGLGQCPAAGNLAAQVPYLVINEVTTVAFAYAMSGYRTWAWNISTTLPPPRLRRRRSRTRWRMPTIS